MAGGCGTRPCFSPASALSMAVTDTASSDSG